MRKLLKVSLIIVSLLFVAAQFVGPGRVNPPVNEGRTLAAGIHVDPEVDAILGRSCMDCHSNKTEWPWYSNVAPVSWFVVDHVNHGRRHLNFSDWARYDERQADHLLADICETTKRGMMPIDSYTLLHPGARLSAADIGTLCNWSQQERRRLASAPREINRRTNAALDSDAPTDR